MHKYILLSAIGAVALGLTGCGDDAPETTAPKADPAVNVSEPAQPVGSEAPKTEPATEPAAEPAPKAETGNAVDETKAAAETAVSDAAAETKAATDSATTEVKAAVDETTKTATDATQSATDSATKAASDTLNKVKVPGQ